MKLYTEEELLKAIQYGRDYYDGWVMTEPEILKLITPIELPSDEEIEIKYNKFIDDEIQLGFLKQEQGERLKWYYKTYFINKL